MEHTVSHFFLLIPLPLKARGTLGFSLQTECFFHFNKEEIIHNSKLLGKHYQSTKRYMFIIPEPQNNSAFSFLIPEYELLWFTFLPKVSQWFHSLL